MTWRLFLLLSVNFRDGNVEYEASDEAMTTAVATFARHPSK